MERSEAEWRALGVPQRYLERYRLLPALGWSRLARSGALRPDEVARLERIASGAEVHPRVDLGRALLLLRDHARQPRCVVHELCAHHRIGCDCHDDQDDQDDEQA